MAVHISGLTLFDFTFLIVSVLTGIWKNTLHTFCQGVSFLMHDCVPSNWIDFYRAGFFFSVFEVKPCNGFIQSNTNNKSVQFHVIEHFQGLGSKSCYLLTWILSETSGNVTAGLFALYCSTLKSRIRGLSCLCVLKKEIMFGKWFNQVRTHPLLAKAGS